MDLSKRRALFKRIVEEHNDALRRLCSGYERNEATRHDLEQEILLNLWRALPRYREDASLRTWLYRVAHNTASKHVRTATRRPKDMGNETQLTMQKATAPGPEDIAVQSNARARLRDCISRLRPLDRQIILLSRRHPRWK